MSLSWSTLLLLFLQLQSTELGRYIIISKVRDVVQGRLLIYSYSFQAFALLALTSAAFSVHAPGGYSYNRFSGPVSGKIIEVQVPAAEGARQHADYGYNHQQGRIDPETARYERLKTVDYKVRLCCLWPISICSMCSMRSIQVSCR